VWSSPYINRFLQPDSIIPDPSDPQAWNRYSYVANHPVNFNDPSGHAWKCTGVNSDHCFDDSIPMYGISFSPTVTDKQKVEAYRAAQLAGEKLAKFIGGTSEEAFREAHGNFSIELDDTRSNCETNSATLTISCGSSALYMTALLHEFGHIFDVHYNDLTNDKNAFGEDIGASGQVPYQWNGNLDGYKCSYSPCMEHSLQHWTNLSHGLDEEFADMYLNWVVDDLNINPAQMGFTNKGLGPERRKWMNDWMPSFLQRMEPPK
jgi:hypothetical protein